MKDRMSTIAKLSMLAVLLAAPFATWAFFKPVRVLAPTLAGVHCPSQDVCVDDIARLEEAVALKAEAVPFVEAKLGHIQNVPRVIFCSTSACAKSFGFTSNAAYNVGIYGLVIAPRGWKPYYLRHELIHHLQNERLGSMHAWLFMPKWFVEGMAYSLSDDPRRPLAEPLEGYRSQFESWLRGVGIEHLWSAAELL
jgi:hypothetical protein